MKQLFLTTLALATTSVFVTAAVLTVDNNPGSVAMYTSLSEAVNDSNPDGTDTILVAGSPNPYGTINAYKEIHIVGMGYLLADNGIPGLSSDQTRIDINLKKDASLGDASNSSVTGITGSLNSDPGTTGITIDQCYGVSWNWRFQGQTTVTRCFNPNQIRLDASTSSISNSIVGDITVTVANTTVTNCVVTTRISTVPSSSVSNTIFLVTNGNNFIDNGSFSYCMTIGTSFLDAGSGNINNQLLSDVFTLTSGPTKDAYYVLKSGSVAAGVGFTGVDMGAFGGSNPYVLSGVPGHPRLTRLTVPSTATGLTALTFEVEAQAFAE